MHELRYYQREAVQALMDHDYTTGNPVVVLPTGTGKSLVIADFIKRVAEDARVLVCTHSKDIVQQNHDEFVALETGVRAGIYSAGLGKRQTRAQVTFCGIQSVHRRARELGKVDILMADEAHAIPRNGNTMWQKFIAALREINPDLVVIGLTATPFRLDSGLITEGANAIFTRVIYEYGILQAIKDGYLCPPVTPDMVTRFDISGVNVQGGEYNQGQLEAAMMADESRTERAIDEVMQHGIDRHCWLAFCAGIDHANEIAWRLNRRGIDTKAITSETPPDERDEIMADYKAGRLRCVTNMKVMTTGTNVPRIDMIIDFMATKSAGLHVQKLGRGSRLFEGKKDFLVVDFVRNTERHGPLDKIRGRSKKEGSGNGDAPVKVCPSCGGFNYAGVRYCVDCGHEFPAPEMDFDTKASDAAILSIHASKSKWINVSKVVYSYHKTDRSESMKVAYLSLGHKPVYEFIYFNHPEGSSLRSKATRWGLERGFSGIENVAQALTIQWPQPKRVEIHKPENHWNVKNYDFSLDAG